MKQNTQYLVVIRKVELTCRAGTDVGIFHGFDGIVFLKSQKHIGFFYSS